MSMNVSRGNVYAHITMIRGGLWSITIYINGKRWLFTVGDSLADVLNVMF